MQIRIFLLSPPPTLPVFNFTRLTSSRLKFTDRNILPCQAGQLELRGISNRHYCQT